MTANNKHHLTRFRFDQPATYQDNTVLLNVKVMVFRSSQGTTTEFDQSIGILQVYDIVGVMKDERLCKVIVQIKAAPEGAAKQRQLSITHPPLRLPPEIFTAFEQVSLL